MTIQPFILDGDFGIDDSLATLFLAAQPDVEILAVGSVHGNARAEVASRNARTVLDLAGLSSVPVATGARRPMAQPLTISSMVHGADGLGGRAPARAGRPPVAESAAEQLVAAARARPGACTVLATGPLTNLALALLLEPELVDLVARVVVMGGTIEHPGNVGPMTEANIAHDPEAADLVLGAGWPVTLVGLDVTMTTWLEHEHLERIAGTANPRGRFAWGILQHYLAFYYDRHGRRGCPLHDPTAAVVAVEPSLATCVRAPVSVELRSNRNRGMLVADRRDFVSADAGEPAPLIDVAMDLDRGALIAKFLDGLLLDAPGDRVG
jgi:purine nucleosidase